LALVSCTKESTRNDAAVAVTEVANVERRDADVGSGFGWLPADTTAVASFPAERIAMLDFLRNVLAENTPACVDALQPRIDRHVMVTRIPRESAVNVLFARVTRDELEACVADVLARMATPFREVTDLRFEAKRAGRLTELIFASGQRTFVGFGSRGEVVWHDDRAMVERVLDTTERLPTDGRLREMLELAATEDVWGAGVLDFGTRILGIRSLGFAFHVRTVHPTPSVPVRLMFASSEDATRALATLGERSNARNLPASLQAALTKLDARVEGNELHLDAGPLMAPPATAALLELVQLP
jgi:hypothetical protein